MQRKNIEYHVSFDTDKQDLKLNNHLVITVTQTLTLQNTVMVKILQRFKRLLQIIINKKIKVK